ncbi:MAG TPA: YkgJ family cysteine cluster protein [Treponemataceae bacterium]|nr:YkgJ family cysteine cluster protein [Treponemataceae bacterium]
MNEPFYSNGLRFTCQRCSACCRFDPGFVNISEQDLTRLCTWSGMTREVFIETYCRWVNRFDGYEYLYLLEKDNCDCILWDQGCIAYEYRPLQCSSYPFWPSTMMDKDYWDAYAQTCPGINTGSLHSMEEIEGHLTRRRSEPYIRREKLI